MTSGYEVPTDNQQTRRRMIEPSKQELWRRLEVQTARTAYWQGRCERMPGRVFLAGITAGMLLALAAFAVGLLLP